MSSSPARKPPMSRGWKRSPRGECRWCRSKIVEDGRVNTNKRWHDRCLKIYLIATRSEIARVAVALRDAVDGLILCAGCETNFPVDTNEWEVDHTIPLWKAPRQIKFWLLGNLQPLCVPCHKAKTAAEATERATQNRGTP